jgi:hypothetical protein
METIGQRKPGPEAATAAASGKRNTGGGGQVTRAPAKPAPAFKQALARAMEGWGPDAPMAATRSRAATVGAPTQRAAAAAMTPRAQVNPASVAFRAGIARLESGPDGARGGGHGMRNPSSGALGRYQMLPLALRDIGWQDASGAWTETAARHGVRSEAEFLASPAAQEAAMDAFLHRAEAQLSRNGSLARAGGQVTGLDGAAVKLTEAGLVAAAHRRGAQSVARYLAHRSGSPDVALSPAERQAFAAVERRLRDFAEVPYALASAAPSRRTPPTGTG